MASFTGKNWGYLLDKRKILIQTSTDRQQVNYMSLKGLQFEEEIRDFLKDLDYQDVDGGRSFIINGIQVDAVAGHENTLLVIACTTKKKLRNTIEAHRGNMKILKQGFKASTTYKKYKNFRFIVATNRHKIRDEDSDFAEQKPKVYIWDGRFYRYYEKLYKLVGKYAKYNILAEIDIKPLKESIFRSIALRTDIRGFTAYIFFINPKKLLEFSYVARRERGEEHYYQRFIKADRLKAVVKFLDEKRGIFPTNVIISINKPIFSVEKTEKGAEIGFLEFPENYRSCWVIDGQHRLYGFCHSESTIPVPVLAFERLDLERHARFFLEINKEQRTVPPDLLWDLEGLLRKDEEEGIISRICKRLNSQKGPLEGRIYIPVEGFTKKGSLKLSGLCKSIQKAKLIEKYSAHLTPAKGTNPLHDKDVDLIVRRVTNALNKYFNFIDQHFGKKEKDEFIYTNGGISVMIYLFERIMAGLRKVPRESDLKKYLSPVIEHLDEVPNLREIRDRCNSEGGRDGVVIDFLRAILKKTGDKQVCIGIEPVDLDKIITKQFEPLARNFTKKVLIKKFSHKWSNKIPSDILQKIQDRHGTSPPNEAFFENLDLGDIEKIMRTNSKIFLKILLNPKFGFSSEEELWAMYHLVKRYRDATAHGKEIVVKYRDEELIYLIVDKYIKIFEQPCE